jgi:hypothetical protein
LQITRITGREQQRPRTSQPASSDLQRRRREVALTARWLRELRGLHGTDASVAGATRLARSR